MSKIVIQNEKGEQITLYGIDERIDILYQIVSDALCNCEVNYEIEGEVK